MEKLCIGQDDAPAGRRCMLVRGTRACGKQGRAGDAQRGDERLPHADEEPGGSGAGEERTHGHECSRVPECQK